MLQISHKHLATTPSNSYESLDLRTHLVWNLPFLPRCIYTVYGKMCHYIFASICPMLTDFGRPFVKRFALCYQTVVCPVCDVGTLWPQFSAHICCGQTAGWIKMALGMEVGLGPGHIVLDGDQLSATESGTAVSSTFRHMSIVAKRSPISATAELL